MRVLLALHLPLLAAPWYYACPRCGARGAHFDTECE
jgi:hypothetical protein